MQQNLSMEGMINVSLLELEQKGLELKGLEKVSENWGIHFDLLGMQNELEELEHRTSEPQFWDDTENSQSITTY